ncbi:MAG: hypothetical protein J6T74_02935 [Clostridia bacterium]|nr:hypothetical protein [Clostridia bacterium]
MKKTFLATIMLLLFVCLIFTGCAPRLEMPTDYSNVVSNGGFVVGSGNYMFFGNAYKNYSSLQDGDNDGNVNQYSINRLQLDRQTHPRSSWFKIQKNEDGEFDYEKVVDKISAYETANMFVVNEYLYFTTPNIHKNNKNEHEYELSTLFRIRLDGTGLKELYTTEVKGAKIYLTGGENQMLIIFDDNKLKTINVSNNETRVKNLVSDTKVVNIVFPKNQEDISYLYFTTDRTSAQAFSGNLLYKVSIKTGELSQIENLNSSNQTISLLAYDNGILFYSKKVGNENIVYSTDFSTSNSKRHLSYDDDNAISSLIYVSCEDANNNCFAFIYNKKLYIQLMTSENISQAKKLSDKSAKIQFAKDGYIYYSDDDGIYRISAKDKIETQISNITEFISDLMDFDGKYVYFYGKEKNVTSDTYYLYRADTYLDEIRVECIADILDEDVATEVVETEE